MYLSINKQLKHFSKSLRRYILVLPGKRSKEVFSFQISPRTTLCPRATVWADLSLLWMRKIRSVYLVINSGAATCMTPGPVANSVTNSTKLVSLCPIWLSQKAHQPAFRRAHSWVRERGFTNRQQPVVCCAGDSNQMTVFHFTWAQWYCSCQTVSHHTM